MIPSAMSVGRKWPSQVEVAREGFLEEAEFESELWESVGWDEQGEVGMAGQSR